MPRKKIEENHTINEPDFSENPAFSEAENTPYEPDMAPLAKEDTSESVKNTTESYNTEKTGVFIKLTGGGSFTTGEYFFKNNEAVSVPEKLAKKLMKTGFFEKV